MPCGSAKNITPGTCRDAYGSVEPPCERCFPGIHKFNKAAVIIYQTCGEQYVSTSGGAIGLDLMAANKAMDWHNVPSEDRPELFDKVQQIVKSVISECKKEAEKIAKTKSS